MIHIPSVPGRTPRFRSSLGEDTDAGYFLLSSDPFLLFSSRFFFSHLGIPSCSLFFRIPTSVRAGVVSGPQIGSNELWFTL